MFQGAADAAQTLAEFFEKELRKKANKEDL